MNILAIAVLFTSLLITHSLGFRSQVYQLAEFFKLHEAIRNYNELQAFTLIEYDFHRNVDVQNATGWAPLHVAAQAGSEAFAAFLIDNKANLRLETNNGFQPLHIAIVNNRLSFAQLLLKADPSLSEERCCGKAAKSIAHLAAEYNVAEMLYLLPDWFDNNVTDGYDQLPICWAAKNGSINFARKFFDDFDKFDIDSNVCTYANFTDGVKAPLLHTAAFNHQIQFVELLISKGANTTARDSSGGTAIHAVARQNEGDFKMASLIAGELEENGVDVEAKDSNGMTPYLMAVKSSSSQFAKVLLQHFKIDIGTVENHGYSSFHLAHRIDMVDFLINTTNSSTYLMEINRKSLQGGLTPLLLAARMARDVTFIKYLIEHGAKVDSTTDEGLNFLHLAVESGHTKAIRFLVVALNSNLTYHVDNLGRTPIFYAAQLNRTEQIQTLLHTVPFGSPVIDQQAPKVRNYTSVHMAIANDNEEMLEILIAKGASMIILAANGRNALHEAVSAHNYHLTKRLIMLAPKGIDVVMKLDKLGRTACHLSVTNLMTDLLISKMLISKSPKCVNEIDLFGDSPIHRAILHESFDLVQLLLENNASCQILDAQDRTPLALAQQTNNDDIVALIKRYCGFVSNSAPGCHNGEIVCDINSSGDLIAKSKVFRLFSFVHFHISTQKLALRFHL